MAKIANNVTETIDCTSLVRLNRITQVIAATVIANRSFTIQRTATTTTMAPQ